MFEYRESGHSPEGLVQKSLAKYNADVIRLCREFPPAAIEDSEHNPGEKIITYETLNYDAELPDGSPITVSYAHYPNGMDRLPTLRTTTIITEPVEGLGKWITNYHLHQLDSNSTAVEKDHWFMIDPAVAESLKNGTLSPATKSEADIRKKAAAMNLADQKAFIAALHNDLNTPEFVALRPEEVGFLQSYIDELV
jgi:hypothetical protein